MRSMASIGKHPIHPALVAIPIGAFSVALFADLFRIMGLSPDWGTTARHALMVGIAGAFLAAAAGLMDYLFVEMSARAKQLATYHMVLNLAAVVLFVVSVLLRLNADAGWSVAGFLTSTFAFLMMGASGWIGGELVFRHKVAVIEAADPQATAIGRREERDARHRDAGVGVGLQPDSRRH